jgi:hypothetical protein
LAAVGCGLLGLALVAGIPGASWGQEQDAVDRGAARDAGGLGGEMPEFTGYTRPGNPPDEFTPTGDILPVDYTKVPGAIGCSIYFTVLDRNRNFPEGQKPKENDTWGTAFENFDKHFVKGGDPFFYEKRRPVNTKKFDFLGFLPLWRFFSWAALSVRQQLLRDQ